MKHRNSWIGMAAVSILLALSLAASAMAAPLLQAHFKVKLIVSANNTLQSSAQADMTRELQKLSGIEVTNSDSADWLIYVNIDPIIDSKGVKGYIFSTVVADQYSANTIKAMPPDDFKNEDVARTILKLIDNQVILREHSVQTCRPEDLRLAYSKIVDNFDETYLAPAREDIDNFDLNRGMK